jgi:putative nucleotidyltransferase with HDIG domain
VTNTRPLAFILPLGLGTAAIAAAQILLPGGTAVGPHAAILWVSLAVLVALIPIRRLVGAQDVNLGALMMFTVLLLFGTGTALLAAWAVGIASALSARSGNRMADIRIAMLDSGKYTLSIGCAGLILWGTGTKLGAMDSGLGCMLMLRLMLAYALYLAVKGLIRSVVLWLRGARRVFEPRLIAADWLTMSAWIVPPAAYLLALIYLKSGVLSITMLGAVLLVHGITAVEEQGSRSSWVRLTDGIRQACDGHVMKHRSETQAVVEVAATIGRKMRLPSRNLRLLGCAAALHNVGYVALDSRLVLKPGDLSPKDISAVRQHPECSRRILSEVEGMADVAEIVRHHHESPDGRGYPCGLEGDAIPIEAAIIKVAEAFMAMTSPRVYRGKTLGRDQALEEIAGAVGCGFDPVVAYYLFEIMGRADLASATIRRFGVPDKKRIAARLSRRKANSIERGSGTNRPRRRITGLAFIGGATVIMLLLNRFGLSRPLIDPPLWSTLDSPGALSLLMLLGLAVLKPCRLTWGAQCSWLSAVVLCMVLSGGPVYIPISGMAMIGWALLLDSDRRWGSNSQAGCGIGSAEHRAQHEIGQDQGTRAGNDRLDLEPLRTHDRVLARIDRANRVHGHLPTVTYCLVIMVAAGCAWTASWSGQHLWNGSIVGLIVSPLLLGIVSTGIFYLVETWLQAALLAERGPSVSRIWYRNYVAAFPEPLTYAIFGYGVYLVSGLLGFWAAVLVFTLPTVWRHSVIVNRTSMLRMTRDLVKSIANAVDLKDGRGGHASSVETVAVAVARQMDKDESFVEELEHAALLHDIGKASWPNKVMSQRLSWTAKEERYRYIHPDMSAEIAAWAGYHEPVAEMIRSHHEHYDGSGYMRGLKGDQIPLGGRILRVADSFASMIHAGDARFRRTLPEAVREIRFGSAKQFDPEVVTALVEVLERAVFAEPTPQSSPEVEGVAEHAGAGV